MKEKNILLIEESQSIINTLKILINNFSDFNIIVEDNIDLIIKNYASEKYEFIIIEHNCKNSNDFINFICEENPLQKIILLSDSINCPIDCDTCLSSLKFVRLLKPIETKNILYFINPKHEFICPNRYRFDSIDTLEKQFDFINLDENIYFKYKKIKEGKLIIYSKQKGSMNIREMQKILDNINNKYFKVDIFEDKIIIKE